MNKQIDLPAELTIYTVAGLREEWMKQFASTGSKKQKSGSCTVDGNGVGQIDGAGLQMLVSLSKYLAHNGIPIQIKSPSKPLFDALSIAGLAALLCGQGSVQQGEGK